MLEVGGRPRVAPTDKAGAEGAETLAPYERHRLSPCNAGVDRILAITRRSIEKFLKSWGSSRWLDSKAVLLYWRLSDVFLGNEAQVNLSLAEPAEFSEKNKKSPVHSAGSARYL